ncbi:MAG: aldose epimerase family protein [Daejeonella sp.]
MKATKTLQNIDHATQEIYSIILENDSLMQVVLSNYGGLIQKIIVPDRDGNFVDVVLGFDDLQSYFSKEYLNSYPYFGAIIGRYANRIGGSKFSLNGKEIEVSKNDGENQLHGGKEGFDKKVWKIVDLISEPNPKLTLEYLSRDGEEGFPGNLKVNLTFELNNEQELALEIKATTDAETVVNMTHHSYFNLNGNNDFIGQTEVEIPARSYLEQDENFVLTGNKIEVENTTHDFNQARKISENWDAENGYDQAFVINKPDGEFGKVATAYSSKTGIEMNVFSNQPVVQFYTAKHLNVKNGKSGLDYKPFSAFCFEPQIHPNAVNIKNFPETSLKPGEEYLNKTTFKFTSR